jgi:hypothetical protein
MEPESAPYSNEEIPQAVSWLQLQASFDGAGTVSQIRRTRTAASLLELSRLRQQVETLLKFAALVTREVRDGMDVDGGYVQTIATEAGLFIPEVVTAPCREYPGCACAGYGEWPMTCYRDSPELAAARSGEGGNPT